MLDQGKDLGMPDGVLINGKGPYRYNDSLVPAGIEHETIDVHPGNSFIEPSRNYSYYLHYGLATWKLDHVLRLELCFVFG